MKKILAIAVAAALLVSMTSCFSAFKKIFEKAESIIDDVQSRLNETESTPATDEEPTESTAGQTEEQTEKPVTDLQTEEPAAPSEDGMDLIGTWTGSADIGKQITDELKDQGIEVSADSFVMNYSVTFDGENYSFAVERESLKAECDKFAEQMNKIIPDIAKKSFEEMAALYEVSLDELISLMTDGECSTFEEYWNQNGSEMFQTGDDYYGEIIESFENLDESVMNGKYTVQGGCVTLENGANFNYSVDGDTLTVTVGDNSVEGQIPFDLPATLTRK